MPTLPDKYRNGALSGPGVVALIDSGTGTNAKLLLRNGTTTLIEFDLNTPPSFEPAGTTTPGVSNANGLPKTATASFAGGPLDADNYQVLELDGTVGPTGTDIGTSGSGSEVEISPSISITDGTDYDLTAFRFGMPAS